MKKFISGHNNRFLIYIAIFIFIVLFVYFYPPIYTIQDEADYFDFAYRLKEGTIYFEPLTSHKIIFNGTNYVNMYPPGMAVLLLPFTFIHWKAIFLLNPLLHLIAFVFFYKTLKLLEINEKLSLLYLFFPPFVLYARTLVADAACASI